MHNLPDRSLRQVLQSSQLQFCRCSCCIQEKHRIPMTCSHVQKMRRVKGRVSFKRSLSKAGNCLFRSFQRICSAAGRLQSCCKPFDQFQSSYHWKHFFLSLSLLHASSPSQWQVQDLQPGPQKIPGKSTAASFWFMLLRSITSSEGGFVCSQAKAYVARSQLMAFDARQSLARKR